jgi:hypothetical protein
MSNTSVGAVYAQIMADVIDSSRIDFEEMGVEESVLDELKKVSAQDTSHHYISYSANPFLSVVCIIRHRFCYVRRT